MTDWLRKSHLRKSHQAGLPYWHLPTKLKFDQDFKACWSFCFELKVLIESKCSMPWVRCAFGNVFFVFVLLNCYRVVREQLVTCCTKLFQNALCGWFAKIYWFVRNCLMHVTDLPSGYNWTYLTSSSFLSSPSPPPSLSPLVAPIPPFPAVSIDLASTAEASEDTGQGSIPPPIVKFPDYIFTRILVRILPPWISPAKRNP